MKNRIMRKRHRRTKSIRFPESTLIDTFIKNNAVEVTHIVPLPIERGKSSLLVLYKDASNE